MARTELQQLASRRGGEVAGAILKEVNEARKWGELLASKDQNIVLKALIYLSDRAYGKAPQAIEVTETGNKFGFDIIAKPDNATEAVQ